MVSWKQMEKIFTSGTRFTGALAALGTTAFSSMEGPITEEKLIRDYTVHLYLNRGQAAFVWVLVLAGPDDSIQAALAADWSLSTTWDDYKGLIWNRHITSFGLDNTASGLRHKTIHLKCGTARRLKHDSSFGVLVFMKDVSDSALSWVAFIQQEWLQKEI